MKKLTLKLVGIVVLAMLAVSESNGQSVASSNNGSKQERLTQELLNEVRQLRIALQRIGVDAYRGQVLVERLRLQQVEVNRLAEELNKVTTEIGDVKTALVSTMWLKLFLPL